MIVTFPHLGAMAYALSDFLNELDICHVVPPENGQETLEAGIEISPEEMCLPFKFMAGNLKRAYDMGADTAIMAATCGPCRLGEYCQLLMETMENAGCSYRWILLDSPAEIGLREFKRRCELLTEGRHISPVRLAKSIASGINMMVKLDRLTRKIERRAGYLDEPYEAVRLLHETEDRLKAAGSFAESMEALSMAGKRLKRLAARPDADPVRVLVTGEIYTSIEKEANGRLEEKLMLLGCSVEKHLSISWWLRHTLLDILAPSKVYDLFDAGGGIPCNVGGYGRQTVSKILRSGSFDGVVKLMPSGCMPEIVAKAFCERLQKEQELRILYLIYDEMSGEAGYQTRTEAFVDMLERRKHVLDGNRHRLHKH